FEVRIDDASDRAIHEQIVSQIQEAVATGTLRPGNRLPPVRQLADQLEIAPGTVARAYSELERRGIVVTDGARGTRVAERPRTPAESHLPPAHAGPRHPTPGTLPAFSPGDPNPETVCATSSPSASPPPVATTSGWGSFPCSP